MSTHSLEFVLDTASRVILIRDGAIMKSIAVPKRQEEQMKWRAEVIQLLGGGLVNNTLSLLWMKFQRRLLSKIKKRKCPF